MLFHEYVSLFPQRFHLLLIADLHRVIPVRILIVRDLVYLCEVPFTNFPDHLKVFKL